jgi:hypothetical protein
MKKQNNAIEKGKIAIYYLHNGDNIPFYVGKTNNPYRRNISHKYHMHKSVYLEIIDEIYKEEWKFWECYWIEQFKQWGFQLENKNNGGGGLTDLTEEHINKLKKPKSEIARKNMSNGKKGHPMYTQEWKQNISKSKKGIPNPKLSISRTGVSHPKKSKRMFQYDKQLNLIKIWDSAKQAGETLKINPLDIQCVARNKQKTAKGFIWKYEQ